jgi:hypothetical protein
MATWLKPNTITLKRAPRTAFTARPGPMWNGVNGIVQNDDYAPTTRPVWCVTGAANQPGLFQHID